MAAQTQYLTIKAKLEGSEDMRRVTLPINGLTFAVLQAKLAAFFNYKNNIAAAKIKYIDPDGDKITLSSDEELREALNITSSGVLRVFVTIAKTENQPAQQSTKDTPENGNQDPFSFFNNLVSNLTSQMNPEVAEQLSQCANSFRENLPQFLGQFEQIQQNLSSKLLHTMHATALSAMENGDKDSIKSARGIFRTILQACPGDYIARYNLACSESLLGNKQEAIKELARSVDSGYSNVEHMKADSDLDNIRNEPDYIAIVQQLESMHSYPVLFRGRCAEQPCDNATSVPKPAAEEPKPEPVEPKQEEKPQPKPEPTVVAPEEVQEEEKPSYGVTQSQIKKAGEFTTALKNLEGMGFMDRKKNIQALIDSRVNLPAAIELLLSQ